MISLLTGLKVSSLACKYRLYKPEHNAKGDPMEINFEGLKMQKGNLPTDRELKEYGSFV